MSQLIEKEGRFFKECNIVMLPTEDYTNIVNHGTGLSPYHKTKSEIKFAIEQIGGTPQHLYITSDDEIKGGDYYLCPENKLRKCKTSYVIGGKKIIATTDESLSEVNVTNCGNINCEGGVINGTNPRLCKKCNPNYCHLPQPSHKFIKAFCEQGGIDKVLVEYEMFNEPVNKNEILAGYIHSFKLKTDTHNTITIKPVKDSWTREEVETLLFEYADNHALLSSNSEIKAFNKWIKENL